MPYIYEYLDYRKFLLDYYKEEKARNPKFSHRYIAKRGGLGAGLFSKILAGKRHISLKMIFRFVEVFKLGKREEEYFELLVLFNQAKTHAEKKHYFEKLLTFREVKVGKVEANQYEFYNKWYYTAMRELLNVHPFRGNHEELGSLLNPPIKAAEAKKAIELLEALGFIAKDREGRYRLTEPLISSGYDGKALNTNNFILAGLDLAKEAIDRFSREESNLSTVTFTFPARRFKAIEEKIRECRRSIMQMASREEEADTVYQLSIQLFPMSRTTVVKKP